MAKKVEKQKKRQDSITGIWSSENGLWFNPSDPSGLKIGDVITFTLDGLKSKKKSFVGICTKDDNDASGGSRSQEYALYVDRNSDQAVGKRDKLVGPFAIYTYGFISEPVKTGTFKKIEYDGPLAITLGSPDALRFSSGAGANDPPGPVGYGGTLGANYF